MSWDLIFQHLFIVIRFQYQIVCFTYIFGGSGGDVPQVSKERKYFTVYIYAIAYIVSSVVRHFKSSNCEIFQFHCLTFVQIVYAGR